MYQTIAERLWSDPAPGIWKSQPQDFQVEELWTPPSAEDGEGQQKGEHVLLLIEKAGQNTQWVARQIARYAGVRDMDIGFHGLKDRHALTRQWLSVYLGRRKEPDWLAIRIPGVNFLRVTRTRKKLRRGEHQGNHFNITLREVEGDGEAICRKLERVKSGGIPNYFGVQRFGRDGHNLKQVDIWFSENRQPGKKSAFGMLLSAARAYLFNRILERRVKADIWSQTIPGDELIEVAGASGGVRAVPSGPMLGGAEFLPDRAGEIERSAVNGFDHWLSGIHRQGVRTTRRAFSVVPENLNWSIDETTVNLQFDLVPGAYASVLLDQVFDLRTTAFGQADS